jgi:hypothetical protein
MEGRIAHLRSHYRLAGAQVAAPAIASRLDRVLREEVIRNYGEALDSALAGDESVYVLRRVKVRTRMLLSDDLTDAEIAKRWGVHLATAVMRAIAKGEDDPGNVVRFENQADYVAAFIVALLRGTQQTQWYYDSFTAVDDLDKAAALRRVLLDNVSAAPAILAYVHRAGELNSLIAALDEETKRALWSPQSEQCDDLEVGRSLFSTALQFIEKLGRWYGPLRNSDDLFQSYWSTSPPFADWRDPRSLAEYVFEVVRHFFARGYLAKRYESEELSFCLDEALENFEWLDREWLRDSVLRLFDQQDRVTPDLPLRAVSGRATPRQHELLGAIASAVGETWVVSVDDSRVSAALKLLSLLVDAAPGWADDTAAKVMIDNLITVRDAIQHTTAREEFVKRLRCRDVEGALRLLSDAERARDGKVVSRDVEGVRERAEAGCRDVEGVRERAEAGCRDVEGVRERVEVGCRDVEGATEHVEVECRDVEGVRERVEVGCRDVEGATEHVEVECRDVEGELRLTPNGERTRLKLACRAVVSLGEPALVLIEKLSDTETKALVDGVESECAGVSLLLRTFFDARLHRLDESVMLFLALALRLNGEKAFVNERLDPGLCLLAGMEEPPTLEDLRATWSNSENKDHEGLQKLLLRIAAGQRLLEPATMHVFRVSLSNSQQALVAADESESVWPLARVIDSEHDVAGIISDWQTAWEDATGVAPQVIVDECENGAFRAALETLDHGQMDNPHLDLTISIVACLLLRMWARWLRGFSTSSVAFLIENFVRRSGTLRTGKDALHVELERRPLDVVIEMAGYLADLERIPWLPGRRIKFSLKGA